MKELHEHISEIDTKEKFLVFLNHLIRNLKNNSKSWHNNTLESYLEGIESWVDDMDGYYENTCQEVPKNFDWKILADILYAAKLYE